MHSTISSSGLPAIASTSLAVLATLLFAQQASAHGYLAEPPSRAYQCRVGQNTDCGPATYEPQSVGETQKGFPASGPADGKIASGGSAAFAPLDIQTASRWARTEIKDRTLDFNWYYHAAHLSTGWQYFITRPEWNPNQPLSRAAFDLTPFCSVAGNGGVPINGHAGGTGPAAQKHRCTVPADRSGPHVILGVWTVADTAAAFYNVVDVDITADGPPVDGWWTVGAISPNRTLLAGDKVLARAFKGSAPSPEHSVELAVTSTEQGLAQNWSYALAQKINSAQPLIRAGVRDEQGTIEPVHGSNGVFAKRESGVTGYELQYELVADPDAFLQFQGAQPSYVLEKGRAQVGFTVMTNRQLDVQATIFDEKQKQVGFVRQSVGASTTPLTVDVRTAPGAHEIVLVGRSEDGRISLQAARTVEMTGEAGGVEYDFVYPEGIAAYKAGTKVLQPQNDQVYECKPFPYEGWCRSSSALHYAPGVGSNWTDAWLEH